MRCWANAVRTRQFECKRRVGLMVDVRAPSTNRRWMCICVYLYSLLGARKYKNAGPNGSGALGKR